MEVFIGYIKKLQIQKRPNYKIVDIKYSNKFNKQLFSIEYILLIDIINEKPKKYYLFNINNFNILNRSKEIKVLFAYLK